MAASNNARGSSLALITGGGARRGGSRGVMGGAELNPGGETLVSITGRSGVLATVTGDLTSHRAESAVDFPRVSEAESSGMLFGGVLISAGLGFVVRDGMEIDLGEAFGLERGFMEILTGGAWDVGLLLRDMMGLLREMVGNMEEGLE